jgi:hypothetical protein
VNDLVKFADIPSFTFKNGEYNKPKNNEPSLQVNIVLNNV